VRRTPRARAAATNRAGLLNAKRARLGAGRLQRLSGVKSDSS
jgi:hypothetical protein